MLALIRTTGTKEKCGDNYVCDYTSILVSCFASDTASSSSVTATGNNGRIEILATKARLHLQLR